jgi:hypothetical protein
MWPRPMTRSTPCRIRPEAPTSTRQERADALEAMEQDQPTQSDQAPAEASAPAQAAQPQKEETEPEPFSENFDPSKLPEELRPAYNQLRADYTRKTQTLAEQRKQAEGAQAFFNDLQSEDTRDEVLKWFAEQLGGPEQLAQYLGFEVDDPTQAEGDEEEDFTSPQLTAAEQRLAALEARETERLQAEQARELDQKFQTESEAIEKEIGFELPQEDWQRIVEHALGKALVRNEPPDLRGAFEDFQATWTNRQKGWASSKETTHMASGGEAATEQPDLDTPLARRDHMASLLQPWIDQSAT